MPLGESRLVGELGSPLEKSDSPNPGPCPALRLVVRLPKESHSAATRICGRGRVMVAPAGAMKAGWCRYRLLVYCTAPVHRGIVWWI